MTYNDMVQIYRQDNVNFLLALHAIMAHGQDVKEMDVSGFGNFVSEDTKTKVRDIAIQLQDSSLSAIMALIQREMPTIEGDGKDIPLLNDGHKDGICPCCGAKIEYQGDQEITDDSDTCVSWKCPECGAHGESYYIGAFDGHGAIEEGKEGAK